MFVVCKIIEFIYQKNKKQIVCPVLEVKEVYSEICQRK